MTFEEYIPLAMRTRAIDDYEKCVQHALYLTGSEYGETVEIIRKHENGEKHIDPIKYEKELGDILWGIAELCDAEHVDTGVGDLTAYQADVTKRRMPPVRERIDAVMGIGEHLGAIYSMYQHRLQDGSDVNAEKLKNEILNILECLVMLCNADKIQLNAIACGNIEKLKKRFPAGFDADRSKKRHEIEG